jgi:RNA polymerase sigma-70 factor (ECF subfamily)
MSDFPPEFDADDRRDVAWMDAVKQGDMDAFERLVETHQAKIIGTAAKMLGDAGDAEDIAQQVFVRVWNSADRYEPTARFTTWLFKITRNLTFNELRRRKRHPVSSLESELGSRVLQLQDPQSKLASAVLIEQEVQTAIQAAIDGLPEVQRMAVVLRRYQDVSYEEIGKILDLSVPAVKSVLFRARTQLRERLRGFLSGED